MQSPSVRSAASVRRVAEVARATVPDVRFVLGSRLMDPTDFDLRPTGEPWLNE